MRLIDADNLGCGYGEKEIQKYGNDFDGGVLFTLDFLSNNAETVDAVPVVRCLECKSFDGYEFCNKHGFFVDPDGSFFCKSGERKGDADDAAAE